MMIGGLNIFVKQNSPVSLSINLMTGTDERPEILREIAFATDESQRLYTLRIIVNLDKKPFIIN